MVEKIFRRMKRKHCDVLQLDNITTDKNGDTSFIPAAKKLKSCPAIKASHEAICQKRLELVDMKKVAKLGIEEKKLILFEKEASLMKSFLTKGSSNKAAALSTSMKTHKHNQQYSDDVSVVVAGYDRANKLDQNTKESPENH